MAATAFQIYSNAKKQMMKGLVDLDSDVVRGYLYKSTSNASTAALILIGSFTNAVSGGGYGGAKSLTSIAVTLSGTAAKFDAADIYFSANATAIGSIMYFVIASSHSGVGNTAVAWSKLSSSVFNVAGGNRVTIQFNSAGIFNLT